MTIKSLEISWLFAWYDFWIGVYWDQKKRALFILPLPMLGIKIQFGMSKAMWRLLIEAKADCYDKVIVEE